MKRAVVFLLILSLLLGMSIVGCSKGESGEATTSGEQNTEVTTTTTDEVSWEGKNELTSLEAAALAYSEAVKWREDAVLWYMLPVAAHLTEDWQDTDIAFKWAILFVSKQDTKRFNVTIQGGKVINAVEEKNVPRISDVQDNFPVDRPGITMKEAGATAIANNMPSHITPMIVYTIDNATKKYRGQPVWEFVFSVNDVFYNYTIDGLTGELLGIVDKNGDPIEPPAAQVEVEPTESSEQSARLFISLLDSGQIETALGKMTSSVLPNEERRQSWSNCFATIESIKVNSVEEAYKDEWTSSRELYKYNLTVKLKAGAQPGLWEDGENIRWIAMEKEDGQWKVREISMNP